MQDDESERPRAATPEGRVLGADAAPSSEAVAAHVHVASAKEDTCVMPESAPRARTRTFETSDSAIACALRAQCTPQVLSYVRRFAEARARMVRRFGRACPPPRQYAWELVNDACADTWSGERAWDHERVSLVDHLCGVIQSRTSNEIRAGRKHTSLDAPIYPNAANDNDGTAGRVSPALVDSLSASAGDIGSPVVRAALVARTCDALRLVSNDRDCIAVVRAWQRGFIERDEVMELTGLDAARYRRARDRLFYLSQDLPNELRQLVRDYLRSA